ncbi:MAG: aspartate-semialdehyde dehydrogenase [Firmicutes bacterium]|nr:aspartate-semialdehyde dehydrogenase [Bacillota bacterium]
MKRYQTAVLGATGAVGEEILSILAERDFPVGGLKLLASGRSAGKKLVFRGREYTVEEAGPDSFKGVEIAFFSAGGGVSQEFAPIAVEAGAVVIDNTSAFRMDPRVPLVVPEVNASDLEWHQGIIANPNCSTIIMVVALNPIHQAAGIKRIVVSTYQAVSGAGARAIEALKDQVRAYAESRVVEPSLFPYARAARLYPIAFNLIPHIDIFGEAGYTKEEWKMVNETRKIMHDASMAVTATTVRVPVFRCHSESVNVETHRKLSAAEARELLSGAPGVVVQDDPEHQVYPMPLDGSGKDPVFVGRIREDLSIANGLNLWVVGDQIRKGAALNAIQIAEYLIEHHLLQRPA